MAAIATCPTCQGLVTLPSDARASFIVRCPLCHAQYKLDAVHEQPVPTLEVVSEDLHVFDPATELAETVTARGPLFEEQAEGHDDAISADELGLNLEHARDGETIAEPAKFASEEISFEPLDIADEEPLDLDITEEAVREESAEAETLATASANGEDFVRLVPPEPLAEVEQGEAEIDFAEEEKEEIDFAPSELDELEHELSQGDFHPAEEATIPANEFELPRGEAELEEELTSASSDLSFEPEDVPFVPVPEDDEDEIHLATEDESDALEFQEVGAAAGEHGAHGIPNVPFNPAGRKKAAESSLLGNLVGVVGGGVIGISIAYVLLLRFGGPERDVFGLGTKLPTWLVGSEFEAHTGPIAMADPQGRPPIDRDPKVAATLDNKEGGFAPLPPSAASPQGSAGPNSPSTPDTSLPPTAAKDVTPPAVTPAAPARTTPPPAQGDPFANDDVSPTPSPVEPTTPRSTQTAATTKGTNPTTAAEPDPFAAPGETNLQAELPTTVPDQGSQPTLTAPGETPTTTGSTPATAAPPVTPSPATNPTPTPQPTAVTPSPTVPTGVQPPTTTPPPTPNPQPQPAPTVPAPSAITQVQPTSPQPTRPQPTSPQPTPTPTQGTPDPRQTASVSPAPTQENTVRRATATTPPAVQPGTAPEAKVALIAPPNYSPQDLARSLTDAQTATQAYNAAVGSNLPKKEITRKKAGYFRKLYEVAGRATYAADLTAQDRAAVRQVALAAARDKDARVQVAGAAALWLKLAPAKRGPHPGIVLTGTVESVSPIGGLVKAQLMPPTGGKTVTLVSQMPGALKPGSNVVLTGAIIEQPQQQLAGYQGSNEQVVLAGMVLPTPNP